MENTARRKFLHSTALLGAIALAGCGGDDGDDGDDGTPEETPEPGSPDERIDQYLSDANGYDGSIADHTGEDEVTVSVGAGGEGWAFDPAAIRIDSGTTIVWEWTGDGGGHNVLPEDDSDLQDFGDDEIVDEEGHTVENTFEESGVGLYACDPHRAQGMLGGFSVE